MSSKRRLRRRSCEKKLRHENKIEAIAHSRSMGLPWHPYKCRFCKGWHVGRLTKKAKMAWRARHGFG